MLFFFWNFTVSQILLDSARNMQSSSVRWRLGHHLTWRTSSSIMWSIHWMLCHWSLCSGEFLLSYYIWSYHQTLSQTISHLLPDLLDLLMPMIGVNGTQAAWEIKKYCGHCVLSENIMKEFDDVYYVQGSRLWYFSSFKFISWLSLSLMSYSCLFIQ